MKVLSRLFRGKFLAFLKKAYERKESPVRRGGLHGILKRLYAKEWVVYAKPPFNGPENVLGYLGRYTHRIAITNHRIVGMENGKVSFFWKDYTDGNKQKVMTLEAFEFIRRFLLHVLPDGFVKIRHFGFLSNRRRKECLEACRMLLGVKEPDAGTFRDLAGVSLEDHRDRRHPVSSLRGEDEEEGALPGAAMRGDRVP